jgi:hypothetical protein
MGVKVDAVSKKGAEMALLSFIALNVVYYVHFRH